VIRSEGEENTYPMACPFRGVDRIPFECSALDALLDGGVEGGCVTLLYGEAGTGPLAPLAADVLTAGAWRPADIRAREARLLALLDSIWRIELVKDAAPLEEAVQRPSGLRRKREQK